MHRKQNIEDNVRVVTRERKYSHARMNEALIAEAAYNLNHPKPKKTNVETKTTDAQPAPKTTPAKQQPTKVSDSSFTAYGDQKKKEARAPVYMPDFNSASFCRPS